MNRPATDREPRSPWAIAIGVSVAVHVGAFALGGFSWITPRPGIPEGEERLLQLGVIRVLPEPVEAVAAEIKPDPVPAREVTAAAPPLPPEPTVAEQPVAMPNSISESTPTQIALAPSAPAAASEPAAEPVRHPTESTDTRPGPPPDRSGSAPASAKGNSPLRYLYNPSPRYPEAAKRRGLTGNVTVRFLVTESGSVTNVAVAESSGHRILDEEALRALRQHRFVPPEMNGVPFSTNVEVVVPFVLD